MKTTFWRFATSAGLVKVKWSLMRTVNSTRGKGTLFAVLLSTWLLKWSITGDTTTSWTCGHSEFCFTSWSTEKHPTAEIKRLLLATRPVLKLLSRPRSLRNTKTSSTSFSKKTQTRESLWSRYSSTRGYFISNRNFLPTGSQTKATRRMRKSQAQMAIKAMTMMRKMKTKMT